jgi:hypothetical protein
MRPSRARPAIGVAVALSVFAGNAVAAERKPPADFVPRERVGGAIVFPEKSKRPLPEGYRLLYEQEFTSEASLQDFAMTDPAAWMLVTTNGNAALALAQQSKYKPLVRSPVNIALIADRVFTDFVLEAELVQTGREYGHRDMCLYFGFQNPTNFYYAHIATAADDHAHNIFAVTNAPRVKIARTTTQGVNWGLGLWHRVRLERDTKAGTIKVFFDDMTRPIMVAEDKTFASGYVGFGSFDDTGMVDNIRIWGPKLEAQPTPFFARPAASR